MNAIFDIMECSFYCEIRRIILNSENYRNTQISKTKIRKKAGALNIESWSHSLMEEQNGNTSSLPGSMFHMPIETTYTVNNKMTINQNQMLKMTGKLSSQSDPRLISGFDAPLREVKIKIYFSTFTLCNIASLITNRVIMHSNSPKDQGRWESNMWTR